MKSKLYALYDGDDVILGCFTREELKEICNMSKGSFNSKISRLNRGKDEKVKYKGKSYKVYIYDEAE